MQKYEREVPDEIDDGRAGPSPFGRARRSLALLNSRATSVVAASWSSSGGFGGRRASAALLDLALDFLILGALGAMFLERVLKVLQVGLGPVQLVGRRTDLHGVSLRWSARGHARRKWHRSELALVKISPKRLYTVSSCSLS